MSLSEAGWRARTTRQTDFPLNNLPYGVFAVEGGAHCGVAIGEMILDATRLEADGRIEILPGAEGCSGAGDWTAFMSLGPDAWARLPLGDGRDAGRGLRRRRNAGGLPGPRRRTCGCIMPFRVAEYTDFYAGKHHATNVGTMFRGAENALPANWLSIPIGYNGRASSVVISGTRCAPPLRPAQGAGRGPAALRAERAVRSSSSNSARWSARPSEGMVSVAEADEMIFGYVLLNDWSARDIQAWEYQPLGPFQSKATATTISPWIVPRAALEPFRVARPSASGSFCPTCASRARCSTTSSSRSALRPKGKAETVIARTNYREMYYSSAQQLAHHTTSGCPMRMGDLLGSGTISGPERAACGSLLELSWGGKEPLTLDSGETRSFLEDGDTVTLRGAAQGDGYRVGFGACTGTITARPRICPAGRQK